MSRVGPTISVIVCTFNRAHLLEQLLDSLSKQTAPSEAFEVVVVDNNSTDRTREVADRYRGRIANLDYVFEGKQGLSHARNAGFRAATGHFVAYVDDECIAPPEWISNALRIIATKKPAVMGGPYGCHYEVPRPAWCRDEYFSTLTLRGAAPRPLDEDEYLDGGNLFVQRAVLEELGGFDPRFGMSGKRLGFAEEVEFQDRFRSRFPGTPLLYEPDLAISHMVRKEKLTLGNLVRTRFAIGMTEANRQMREHTDLPAGGMGAGVVALIRNSWDLVRNVWQSIAHRDRRRHPYALNALIEGGFEPIQRLGYVWRACQLRIQFRKRGRA